MTTLACTPFVAACTLTPSPKQQYFAGNEEKGKGKVGGACNCTTYIKLQKVPWAFHPSATKLQFVCDSVTSV